MAPSVSAIAPRPRVPIQRRIGQVVLNVVLWVLALACVFPFLWMIASALKPASKILSNDFFFGYPLLWSNFADAWNFFPFGRFLLNSILMSIGGTFVVVVTATTAGYAFAQLQFPGRDRIFFIYITTMLVPASVTVVPLFIIAKTFQMYDNFAGLILPVSFGAFGTFMLTQFFRTLPHDLADAGRIDGAGESRIFFNIMLPMVKPAIAVLAVFTFISNWTNFLWPLIVTQSQNMATLELGLSEFQGQYASARYLNFMMAGSTIAIVPTIILVLALQKYLVKGLTFTAFGGR